MGATNIPTNLSASIFSRNEPYYSTLILDIDKAGKEFISWELQYPLEFYKQITENCLENISEYLYQNQMDPFNFDNFGSYWIDELNSQLSETKKWDFLGHRGDMSNYVNSVTRAIKLLKSSSSYSDYILIKIAPDHSECCCLNHWSATWQIIDEYIYPNGPIRSGTTQNEGDAVIHQNDAQFVLECHETGPEIVIYLGAIAITVGLIKSVADLIAVILNARLEDSHVIKYHLKTFGNDGVIIQEEEIELKNPFNAKTTHQLSDRLNCCAWLCQRMNMKDYP